MKKKKTKHVSFRVSDGTKKLMDTMAERQRMPLSVLLRKCALTDFRDETPRIKGTDVIEFCEKVKTVERSVETFADKLVNGGEDNFSLAGEFYLMQESLKDKQEKLYKDVEKIRERVKKYCIKKMLDEQVAFIESDVLKADNVVGCSFTEEEYGGLSVSAEAAGMPVPQYIKHSLISKCIVQDIVVDSYPLDEYIPAVAGHARVADAIASDVADREIEQADIDNMRRTAMEAEAVIDSIHISWEQKETRKEANRILKKSKEEIIT